MEVVKALALISAITTQLTYILVFHVLEVAKLSVRPHGVTLVLEGPG